MKQNRQTCTECGKPSLPGLKPGMGKCRYHWNAGVWGEKWADEIERRKAREKARGEPRT